MLTDEQEDKLRRLVSAFIEFRDWHCLFDAAKILGIKYNRRFINPEGMKAGIKKGLCTDEELRSVLPQPNSPTAWNSPNE